MKIGDKFTRLTIISTPFTMKGRKFIKCKCDCNNTISVRIDKLKSNHTRSCGCLQKEKVSQSSRTHGQSKTRLYQIWCHMKNRCYKDNNSFYEVYGGRGIIICEEWLNSPEVFMEWSNKNGYSDNLQIDRINNNGNYSPNNCRWVSCSENIRNQRLLRSTNTSGYRGVSLRKDTNRYTARIVVDYKEISLGCFDTAKEAAVARDQFITEHHLNYPLNFPLKKHP